METKYLKHWEENIGKCHYEIKVEWFYRRKSTKDKMINMIYLKFTFLNQQGNCQQS